jgi:hypothetical protein
MKGACGMPLELVRGAVRDACVAAAMLLIALAHAWFVKVSPRPLPPLPSSPSRSPLSLFSRALVTTVLPLFLFLLSDIFFLSFPLFPISYLFSNSVSFPSRYGEVHTFD